MESPHNRRVRERIDIQHAAGEMSCLRSEHEQSTGVIWSRPGLKLQQHLTSGLFQGSARSRHIFKWPFTFLPVLFFFYILVCMPPQELRSSRHPAPTAPGTGCHCRRSDSVLPPISLHSPTPPAPPPPAASVFETDDTRRKEITICGSMCSAGVIFLGLD